MPQPPTEEKAGTVLDLERRAHQIERRDFQLWSIVVLLFVVLATGFLALILPNIAWNLHILHLDGRYVPQLIFGFIVLVVLVNIYLLSQRRALALTREELMREMMNRQAAEQLSLMDSLTETYNRRYLHEVLAKDFSRAERHGTALTFVMIDVDQFKSVNTRFGHLVGDRVLAEVAQVLKTTFRAADTIIRYGGDEFLVILDGCDEEHARATVTRLHKHVGEWNLRKLIAHYQMQLSCGIALHQQGESPDALLKRADEAMYAQKTKAVSV